VATITRLKSGSWRVQVRRKAKYVNETFLRRKDAEEWGIDIERRIDRQEPTTTHKSRDVQLFSDLVALHRQDLEEVGKAIGRSKTASFTFLDKKLGHLRLPELDRERFIKFGKARALEGAGPVTVGIDLGYIKTILSHAAAVHGVVVSTEHGQESKESKENREGSHQEGGTEGFQEKEIISSTTNRLPPPGAPRQARPLQRI
jgi:hypothetical protein